MIRNCSFFGLAWQDLCQLTAAEYCGGRRVALGERVVFGEGCYCDAFEEAQDAFVYFSKRFFYGALAELVALIVREAGSEDDRAIDDADDFENADEIGVAGELVTAVCALDAKQKAGLAQLLENLGENRKRDMVGVADFLGAGSALTGESKMAEGDQAVVGFFGELEHFRLRTESVLIRVYSACEQGVKGKWFFLVLDSGVWLCV